MIEHILKSDILSTIIILNNPNMSYYFLHKYVCKTNWLNFFKNLKNYTDIIYFLRTNFNFEDFNNEYLLIMSLHEHLEVVKFLLEKGDDAHIQIEYSLRWASRFGHLKVVKILLTRVILQYQIDYALRLASCNDRLQVVKFLLEKGADIHAGDDVAIRFTSEVGNSQVVSLLLEKGANIHAQDDYALIFASEFGRLKVIKKLLEKGADIHADNDAALICAFYHGHLEIVKFLLEKGADIHARNNEGLWWKNGHWEFLKFLENKIALLNNQDI